MNKSTHPQSGVTLIELMIALTISIFLVGGILQVFVNSKQSYRIQENLSRMQENARFAIEFLTRDIRMAGYVGCNRQVTLISTLNTPTAFLWNFTLPIQGFEANTASSWSPTIDSSITSPLGGSDVITIRKASTSSFTVTGHPSNTADLTLEASATTTNLQDAGITACQTVTVNNCRDARVFQVSAITGTALSHTTSGCSSPAPNNASNDLSSTFINGEVHAIDTISYFIRTTPVRTTASSITTDDRIALYRRIGLNSADELVEGIENMQVLYGIDTDKDFTANYYVTADNVNDMSNAVSIRISLLARTNDDFLATAPVPYTFNDTTTTPSDRRLRRVFTTTISLRNRLP